MGIHASFKDLMIAWIFYMPVYSLLIIYLSVSQKVSLDQKSCLVIFQYTGQ